ncbi:MAG TPA: hypothetical protein VMD59_23255 [Acidimicrobiales bacterium]|nr:hypothetical protein [Acidimicrobiales bacterium]
MPSIDVRSAAGRFEVEIDKIAADGDTILLVGTMDGLDCTTVVQGRDAWRMLRLGLRREVLGCMLRSWRRPRRAAAR